MFYIDSLCSTMYIHLGYIYYYFNGRIETLRRKSGLTTTRSGNGIAIVLAF